MNDLNIDRINLVIEEIINKFSEVYLTKRYFGEFPNPCKEAFRLFTSGYCSIFAMILKGVFKEQAEYYLYEDGYIRHLIVKIGEYYYDVRGVVPPYEVELGILTKLDDPFEVPSLIPEDYLFGTHEKMYDDMIEICSQAGINYIKERGWMEDKNKKNL